MGSIEIISASAGSGKTYRLASELERVVSAREARPEGVVAMTFTVKAAGELARRARTHLLRAGRVADAQRLAAARIGTVHSVCAGIVGEFAFDLGLSPELRVLDEEGSKQAIREAMSSVLEPTVAEALERLSYQFGPYAVFDWGESGWNWQHDVRKIIDLARANGIGPDVLRGCAARNREGISALLGRPEKDARAIEADLLSALRSFLEAVDSGDDTTQKTGKCRRSAAWALRRLQAGQSLRWNEWAKLSHLDVGQKSRVAVEPVLVAAARHDNHPDLRADVEQAIDSVFEVAARTLEAYARHKADRGVIDFTDQETLALKLLARPEVQDRLADRIDIVLVDEFQDTSPIQLAIFLALAEIAPRSVWVGDQKQAIYGFRGTDPALMDAVIEQILAGREPESLPCSYRSRPALVDLTSDLYAAPFAARGIPESRVRLRPAAQEEPTGLGPVAECWRLTARNVDQDAAALAHAVAQLLADETVRVRDRVTGDPRRADARDVAILCRRNMICEKVASALAALGIPSRLTRAGLLGTLEGRIIVAALSLWIDPDDTLGAAELGRFGGFSGDGDAWLSQLAAKPGRDALSEIPIVRAVLEEREARPIMGAVEAVDRMVEATGVRELCRRWGDTTQRLANLESLRGHAVTFTDRCSAEGSACTPAGLVRHLLALASDSEDQRGAAREANANAVTLSTWHGAKGLEWPITVLFELAERQRETAALGVHIDCDRDTLDLADPLADRWIRYWPFPYGYVRNGLPMLERLTDHPAHAAAMELADREDLRLLYVGWTRARDRVVLAARQGTICEGIVARLNDTGATAIVEPGGETTFWAGREMAITVREGAVQEPIEKQPTTTNGYPHPSPRTYAPAYRQPSELQVAGTAGAAETIGPRLTINGSPDWQRLGNAVHGFLAADRPGFAPALRTDIAARLLDAWDVAPAIEVADLIAASDRLRAWVTGRWPNARWRHEVPVSELRGDGSIVRGEADLVLETDDGLVVIDHKSFPGSVGQGVERAEGYAGQVAAYASIASQALGRPMQGVFIHMPVIGVVIPIQCEPARTDPTAVPQPA